MPACPGQVGHRRACHDFRQCGLPSGGGYPTRRLDGRVRRLSNAADYSGLWLAMAAAIAVLGTRLGSSGPCSACFDPGIQDLPSRPFRIGARVRVRRWSAPARTGRPDPAARRRSGLLESAYRGALPGRRRDRLDRQSRHGGHGGSSLRRDLAPARVAAPEVLVRYLPPTVRGGAGR